MRITIRPSPWTSPGWHAKVDIPGPYGQLEACDTTELGALLLLEERMTARVLAIRQELDVLQPGLREVDDLLGRCLRMEYLHLRGRDLYFNGTDIKVSEVVDYLRMAWTEQEVIDRYRGKLTPLAVRAADAVRKKEGA